MSQSQASSNARDVAKQCVGPKRWNSHDIAYLSDTDTALHERFCQQFPHLRSGVSFSSFKKYKPYWMRPHKWLTCKCPKCYEMECFLKAGRRKFVQWHDGKCAACSSGNPLWGFKGGLHELYELAVCDTAHVFSSETTLDCAHGQIL